MGRCGYGGVEHGVCGLRWDSGGGGGGGIALVRDVFFSFLCAGDFVRGGVFCGRERECGGGCGA